MAALRPYLILLAGVVLFFRKVLFLPAQWAIPWDLRFYHYPMARWMSDAFRRFELPLWDPFTYCGYPIAADVTLQLFYPPHTLTVALATWIGDGKHLLYALELEVVAHVWLGGALLYRLLRRVDLPETPALAGAIVFSLGPYFASQPQHLGAICVAAWMPLAFEAVIGLRDGWRDVTKLGVAIAMSILSGFPAVTAVTVVACAHLAAALLLLRRADAGLLARAAAGGLLAAALAAVQLLPTLHLIGNSVAKYRADWLGTGGGAPLEALISLFHPNYFGQFQFDSQTWMQPWNFTWSHLYLGIGGLICALAGAFRTSHRLARIVAALTAVALVWFLGDKTFAGRIVFELIPASLRAPFYAEYALPYFALCAAILCALGFDRLFRGRPPALAAIAICVLAADLILVASSRPMNTQNRAVEKGSDYSHMDGYTETPETLRALTGVGTPPWRVDTMRGYISWSSFALLVRVPTASGNMPFAPERLMDVRRIATGGERWGRWYQIERPGSPVLDLMSVRYVITAGRMDDAMAAAGLRYVQPVPGQEIYENPRALPRFRFVPRVQEARSKEEALAVLRDPQFQPRGEAVVEGQAAGGVGTVRVIEYAANRVRLETESAAGGFLATSEFDDGGWRAAIDGAPAPLLMTNVAFRGLQIPAGRHTVEMTYRPPRMLAGFWISLIAWAAVALVMMKARGVLGASKVRG